MDGGREKGNIDVKVKVTGRDLNFDMAGFYVDYEIEFLFFLLNMRCVSCYTFVWFSSFFFFLRYINVDEVILLLVLCCFEKLTGGGGCILDGVRCWLWVFGYVPDD